MRSKLVLSGPNNFDALRIAMALLVVWSHSFALSFGTEANEPLSLLTAGTLNSGNLAVDVFFMISGYLISQSFERTTSPWRFLQKRIRRIHPGFIVATAVCAFVLLPWYAGTHYSAMQVVKTLGLNVLLQGWFVNPNPFVHNPAPPMNGALWSIPFEFWCYLFVLAAGVAGLLRRRALILAGFIAVIAVHVGFDATGRKPGLGIIGDIFGWPYLWSRMLPCFVSGMLVYLYRDTLPRSGWMALSAVIVFIVGSHVSPLVTDALTPVCIPYVVFYVAFGSERFRAARFGDLSYGTYLYAFPIQQLLLAEFRLPFPVYVLASMLLALLAGALSWHGVEKWFHRTERKPDSKSLPASATAISAR